MKVRTIYQLTLVTNEGDILTYPGIPGPLPDKIVISGIKFSLSFNGDENRVYYLES